MAASLDPASADDVFVITRTFDAPRELVFQAWTETAHLTRWFGPVGFTTTARTNDLRPGGVFHYHMRAAGGHEMWGKWVYREIVPPARLVGPAVAIHRPSGLTAIFATGPKWPRSTRLEPVRMFQMRPSRSALEETTKRPVGSTCTSVT